MWLERFLGVLKYNQLQESLEFCNGMMRTLLKNLEDPGSKIRPYLSCREVAKRYNSSDWNGPFWIKPSERGPTFKVKLRDSAHGLAKANFQ